MLGTLSEGAAYLDAIIHPLMPDDIHAGFGLDTNGGVIRPTDGRYFFNDTDSVYMFAADPYVYAKDNFGNPNYPPNSLANDTLVSTPACTSGSPAWINGFFPDDGVGFYSCGGPRIYLVGSSAPLPMLGALIGQAGARPRGPDQQGLRAALAPARDEHGAPNRGSAGVPERARALRRNGHYVVALLKGAASAEMRHIELDGTTTYLGEYGIGAGPQPKWGGAKLEGDGSIVAFTLDTATLAEPHRALPCRHRAHVIYDETGKKVKIHISELVTAR